MKIDAKQVLKDVKGNPLKSDEGDLTVGEIISNILFTDQKISALKGYSLGMKYATEPTVDVDDADLILIKDAIESSNLYTNLVSGQVLLILSKG